MAKLPQNGHHNGEGLTKTPHIIATIVTSPNKPRREKLKRNMTAILPVLCQLAKQFLDGQARLGLRLPHAQRADWLGKHLGSAAQSDPAALGQQVPPRLGCRGGRSGAAVSGCPNQAVRDGAITPHSAEHVPGRCGKMTDLRRAASWPLAAAAIARLARGEREAGMYAT